MIPALLTALCSLLALTLAWFAGAAYADPRKPPVSAVVLTIASLALMLAAAAANKG